jgi:hypothetical protein
MNGKTASTAASCRVGRLARLLRGRRRRAATVAVVAAIGAGVVVTHSALAMDHMGDGAEMCLAVLDAGLLASGAALLHRRARAVPSRRPLILLRPLSLAWVPLSVPAARDRAGPVHLQVFRR